MVQFLGPNGTIWPLKFCRTVGRTILVSSCPLKKKSLNYSRVLLNEASISEKTFWYYVTTTGGTVLSEIEKQAKQCRRPYNS